jgi:predicted nuclease of predicted toxin-antitoxin system
MAAAVIRFFTDQNVADSVGHAILARNHHLTRLRDVMLTNTKDPVIEIACSQSGQVLVSHDKDFKDLKPRLNVDGRTQITKREFNTRLHKIHLACFEYDAARRMNDAFSLIEAEWDLIVPDRPMVIEIRPSSISTRR